MLNKEQFLKKIMDERKIGTSFGGAVITALLGAAGWLTFGVAWIFAFIVGKYSMKKRRKKYYEQHKEELDALWNSYYEREIEIVNKRATARAKGIPTCPHCGSEHVEVFTSIRNSFRGSYEYGVPKMVCKMCGNTFRPGT